jgi:hypothetical protein
VFSDLRNLDFRAAVKIVAANRTSIAT